MLYKNIDNKLSQFIDNPINCSEYLSRSRVQPSLKAKLLYKIPCLRRFITNSDANAIFEKVYYHYLKEAESAIEDLETSSKDITSINNITELFKQQSHFFNIGLMLTFNIDSSNFKEDLAQSHLDSNRFAKLEYHTNRVAEALNLTEDYFYSIATNEKLWISFFLSEVYLMLSVGNFTVEFKSHQIIFKASNALKERMKGYWLSEVLEFNSNISDLGFYTSISESIKKNKPISNNLANSAIDYILDKIFSINASYLNNKVRTNQTYAFLREIIFFSLILECGRLIGKKSINKSVFIKSNLIQSDSITFIDKTLDTSFKQLINNNKGFIHILPNSNYSRGPLGFKYGIRKFAGSLLEAKEKHEKSNFRGFLGEFFEKDYILTYLKKLNNFGYTSFSGFKPNTNAAIKGYDIDIVLHDNKHDIYYFIQVKYKFSALPTYFSEQFKFFNDPDFSKGYIRQLATLKDNFNHTSVRQQLSRNGLDKATSENSYFILLHNIPFLNFYEHEGIYFYEWNLLRNVLQDGQVFWRKGYESGGHKTSSELQLHKPSDIINSYLENSIDGKALKEQFELFEISTCLLNFGSHRIKCPMF